MKKPFRILTLFVAVASMAFVTSCKKDNADLILGKWTFDSVTVTATNADAQAEIDAYLPLVEAIYKNLVLEFKSDNTLIVTGGDLFDADDDDAVVTYSIDGNKLTITTTYDDGYVETSTVDIKTLTSSKLSLEMTEDEEDYSITETLNFKHA